MTRALGGDAGPVPARLLARRRLGPSATCRDVVFERPGEGADLLGATVAAGAATVPRHGAFRTATMEKPAEIIVTCFSMENRIVEIK